MIEEIAYGGWKRNLRVAGATTELIITLDVGPRVLRYAFHDKPNVFLEFSDQLGGAGEEAWVIRGGHRFWTGPEADHSYEPDNTPVEWKPYGADGVEIMQPASRKFGFQKTLRIELLPGEVVRVTHLLRNAGTKPLELTPWALSVMRPGGVALVPQPPLDLHPSEFPAGRVVDPVEFLPNRELVLWPFTNLTDGRYSFSQHFLRLATHPDQPATKIGMRYPTGWVAYANEGSVFAKHLVTDPVAPYPDRGSSLELFTNPAIIEIESLAPLGPLAPGAVREHVEHWVLRHAGDLADEADAQAFFAALPKI